MKRKRTGERLIESLSGLRDKLRGGGCVKTTSYRMVNGNLTRVTETIQLRGAKPRKGAPK